MFLVFVTVMQVNNQAGFTREHARQESETDLLLCSRTYNDESSLGLSGIKWVLEFVTEIFFWFLMPSWIVNLIIIIFFLIDGYRRTLADPLILVYPSLRSLSVAIVLALVDLLDSSRWVLKLLLLEAEMFLMKIRKYRKQWN